MVIVTTFHIDRARELVINNSNSIRDCLLNKLQTIANDLHTVSGNVEASISFNKTNLQAIYNRLCGNHEDLRQAQTSTSPAPLGDTYENATETIQRTFFSNATIAIDATRALLGYVPPARYDVPLATLPLDELYGQLHALHQNSLEWLTHINHNVDSILNMLNPSSPFSQGTPMSRLYEALTSLTRTVNSIHSNLQTSGLNLDQPGPSTSPTRLEGIEQSLELLHRKIDDITTSLASATSGPSVTPKPPTSPAHAIKDLPVYQAAHPTTPCRTYGTIILDGVQSRIPMDILGRPASTALRLELSVTPATQATIVCYKIFDDGYLLTSDDVETAHKLQHYPGDCLALLHQKCPNFIYKIKAYSFC
uniref:TGB3 n=1 Tax=Garlic virus A TaxID=12433 RepID=A0A6M2YWV5_9VIRU|nr:TGB3 [Garlic virus A]